MNPYTVRKQTYFLKHNMKIKMLPIYFISFVVRLQKDLGKVMTGLCMSSVHINQEIIEGFAWAEVIQYILNSMFLMNLCGLNDVNNKLGI